MVSFIDTLWPASWICLAPAFMCAARTDISCWYRSASSQRLGSIADQTLVGTERVSTTDSECVCA
ncbi:hypothetical protein NY08_2240 [Rhodococcus sp. B7740]|nr:hypothetical protein NY08_2240 [Rhodococcus sp. B7740]